MLIEYSRPHRPAGWETTTLTSTTAGTLTIPTDARYAKIKVLTQAVRYRDDGTAPSSVLGYSVAANGEIDLISYEQMENFKIIAQESGAVLEILYYKV